MNRLKLLFSKNKYELSIFSALMMNFLLLFTKDDIMSDILYPLHLVDVKIGFISRTLVGSITGLLWKNPTEGNILFMQCLTATLTFFLTAVFLGRCIKKAEGKGSENLFIISLIIAVCPYGFMSFINLFELLDIYWLLTAVLILLCAENKITAFLIPLLIFTGSWVHYSFFLAFMPLIYVVCMYKCIKSKTKSSYILTLVMVCVSVPTVIYFFATARSFNVMPFKEFLDYIIEKAGSPITSIERYIGTGFRPVDEMNRIYHITDMSEDSSHILKSVIGNFRFALRDTSPLAIITDFILASPLAVFFAVIWKKAIKLTEDKKLKFLYFLCFISPLIQLLACFTSSDTSRWLSLMIISDLFMLAYLIKEREEPVIQSLDGTMLILKKYKTPLIFILCIYLATVFVW